MVRSEVCAQLKEQLAVGESQPRSYAAPMTLGDLKQSMRRGGVGVDGAQTLSLTRIKIQGAS